MTASSNSALRIVMMGTGTFAEPTFEALLRECRADVVGLVTQPERDTGKKRGSTRQTGKGMAAIARDARLPVLQPDSINTPDGLAQLRDLNPGLMVVAAYGQILSREVLAIPTVGTINVHASLLPKYRGAAPVAYAILGGETETGVTIIKVTPGLDSGEMILQESLAIDPADTTGTLEARLAELGAGLAARAVAMYRSGNPVAGVPQDPTQVTKAPKIKKEFGQIDWSKPAEHIARHVRAMQPWPTAFTFLRRPGKDPIRLIVAEVRPLNSVESLAGQPPGSYARADLGDRVALAVSTGSTPIEVIALQVAGGKRMTGDEFLRGYPASAGTTLGPEVG